MNALLKEICDQCGGVSGVARELRISKQAVYKFQEDGFSEERIAEISRLTNIPRSRLRAYSQKKQNEKRAGLAWYDSVSSASDRDELEPRPERPPRSPEQLLEDARAAWRFFDAYPLWRNRDYPPPYPRSPDVPGPPPLPAEVEAIIACYERPHKEHTQGTDTRESLESCARILREGKVAWHVRPYPPPIPITPRLRAIGVGTWSAPHRALPFFRQIAAYYGAWEELIDGAVVFFPVPERATEEEQ
jgi:hypothetical protein